MEKTHFKKLRNPNYIGSYELMTGDKPKEITVIIERAVKEQIISLDKKDNGFTDAMVVYLKGQKPLIANSTNAKAIASATGSPYIEDWVGKKITLYVAKIKAFGETMDALRVRKEPAKNPDLNPNSPKWQGAVNALTEHKVTLDQILKEYTMTPQNIELIKSLSK